MKSSCDLGLVSIETAAPLPVTDAVKRMPYLCGVVRRKRGRERQLWLRGGWWVGRRGSWRRSGRGYSVLLQRPSRSRAALPRVRTLASVTKGLVGGAR